MDLLAILPVDWIPGLFYLKVFALLKLVRLYRLPKLTKTLNFRGSTKTMIRIINVVLILVIIYHSLSCLWCFVILNEDNNWIPPVYWINIYELNFFD